MRNMMFILLVVFVSHAQVKNEQLNLMLWPQKHTVYSIVFLLKKDLIINSIGYSDSRMFTGVTQFLRRLEERTGLFFNQGFVSKLDEFPEAQLQINCQRKGKVGLQEDETYHLSVLSNTITINAATDLGALHALETLSQLLQN